MTLEISIDKQSERFKDHINDPHNERMIFSGMFGIGKSYFLKKFFDSNNDKYLAVNLSPVNYSISNNDDIFRLIKFDILYELIITHKLELEQEVISRETAYSTLVSSKIGSLLEGILNTAPLLNKALGQGDELPDPSPLINFLKSIISKIEEVEKQRHDPNLYNRVLGYIKSLEESVVFESDFITGFITESLNRLAVEKEEHKIKVLIIDDLDRIDPEHIFRLFNIFSSHLSHGKSNTNKFGFDKIIFVCDIENIRNIFSARYGVSTDFSGYIDKFYSTEIFHFDNSSEVATYTNELIRSIKFDSSHNLIRDCLENNGLLYILIKQLVLSGSLNMRRINYIFNNNYTLKERETTIIGSDTRFQNWKLPAIIALEILSWIYGDVATLETALTKTALFEKSREHSGGVNLNTKLILAGKFLPIIDAAQHSFDDFLDKELQFREQDIKYKLTYQSRFNNRDFYFAEIIDRSEIEHVNLFDIIKKALKALNDSDYFKKS